MEGDASESDLSDTTIAASGHTTREIAAMSLYLESGVRMIGKRPPCRDHETLRERYDLIYREHCKGKEVPEIARTFGHSPSYVYRILKRIPAWKRREIKREEAEWARLRREIMAERPELARA